MKLREQKRLLIYLEVLADKLMTQDQKGAIDSKIVQQLTKDEIIKIALWLFPQTWRKETLFQKSEEELLDLIGSDVNILLYTIATMEDAMTNYVKYTQSEVTSFFRKQQKEIHYLASKPVEDWDGYDKANYHSLRSKTNTSKQVYGIFTSDVLAEDVPAVTTKPAHFFDTREEAEAELEKILLDKKFKRKELTIHPLWLLQNEGI
ncbi:MAG: hypothetical protein ACKVIG_08045 [Flavobacteriales bacterium]